MSAIEFIAPAGKTFSVQLYNATTGAPIGDAITPVTDSVPTRYRANTGSATGVVYVVATATNVRAAGYADLDNPSGGYSSLTDSVDSATGQINVTVLPSTVQQSQRSKSATLKVYVGETILTSHNVIDPLGNPVTLTGRTLRLVISDRQGNVVDAVTPTISGSSFTATLSAAVAQKPRRQLDWALRDKSIGGGNAVLGEGSVDVQYAPDE
jgi:hypothetical protein